MRPIYETEEHEKTERYIARAVELRWKLDCERLPRFSPIDFVGRRDGRTKCWLELKRRYVTIAHYPTLAISAAKIKTGLAWEKKSGKHFVLVIWWNDGMYYALPCQWPNYKVERGGRTDRSDKYDEEPMAHFPIGLFKKL